MSIIKKEEQDVDVTQSRWMSWAVWVSITGVLITLSGHLGLYEKIGIDQSTAQQVIDTIGALLVTFGILNNPEKKKSF